MEMDRKPEVFQFVDDLIEGMIRTMNTDESFRGPVNIGNPVEFTILELAEKVIEITNSTSKIIYKELPSDDPLMRKPDIRMAKQELDWEPSIQLEEGLRKTIQYFKRFVEPQIKYHEEKSISHRRRIDHENAA